MSSNSVSSAAPGGVETYTVRDPAALAQNLAQVAAQSQRLLTQFIEKRSRDGKLEFPDHMGAGQTFTEIAQAMIQNPTRIVEAQTELWKGYMELWHSTVRRLAGDKDATPVVEPARGDKRFKDKDWTENAILDFVKQSYLLTSNWLTETVQGVDDVDPHIQRKANFLTKQFIDAISPSNFAFTNPQVIRATLEENGANLVRGLERLIEDVETGGGQPRVRQTDMNAFKVGENIALSKGKVVYRNELMELIHYEPLTEKQFKRPLLIVPPWINKFYILDLKPENSFIRWCSEQGHSVFVISWVNPDARLAEKSFEDYMLEGPLEAMSAIEKATGERDLNMIGYCIGGTLTACTLAWLRAKGDDRVKSATFFTTQIDFKDAGELQIFVDEGQLENIRKSMDDSGGVLDGAAMGATFNMLRSNDLIWSFVVSNYLLGKEPMPFDLLYWNSDSTRMPRAMHLWYLRHCYLQNDLAEGRITLGGEPIDLSKIDMPVYLQSAQDDHISPYPSVWKATQIYSGPVTFMLAGSGHIAGVVNPPSANKYWHKTNSRRTKTLDKWLEGATEAKGSWWPHWQKWITKFAGAEVDARVPGEGGLPALCDAPGVYVAMKAKR